MAISILLRLGGLVLILAAVALVGVLVLGGAAFGGIIFTMLAGAIGVTLWNIWVVASVVAFVAYALLQLRKYLRLRREMKALVARLEGQKSVLLSRLRAYWTAYSRKFFGSCDWIRHDHVFRSKRVLDALIRAQLLQVQAFVGSVRDWLVSSRQHVDGFSLEDRQGELVVVDQGWVNDLVAREAERIDRAAAKYFAGVGRSRSHYLEQGLDALRDDLETNCGKEVFSGLLPDSVIGAVQQRGTDLCLAAESVPILLPLDDVSSHTSQCVVLGLDEAFLRKQLQPLSVYHTILETDDEEHILLLWVVSNIDLDKVRALKSV